MTPLHDNVHENVILDLLPIVRGGRASQESRELVERYLDANPKAATLAALMPAPDPQLELRALERTRREVSRAAWTKGLAIFFTALPLSFRAGDAGFRFLFADEPLLIAVFLVFAAAMWVLHFAHGRRTFA